MELEVEMLKEKKHAGRDKSGLTDTEYTTNSHNLKHEHTQIPQHVKVC